MGHEERWDVLSAGFWYFVDAVMQNVLARQTVLSMQLKEIKDSLLEGVHMRISEGKLVYSLLLQRLNSLQNG